MESISLKGTGVALVTPFNEDSSIDEDSYLRLIEYVVEGGVDFLVLFGTTGESPTVNLQEKQRVLKKVDELLNGKIPLVIGFGGNNTNELVQQIKQFDFSGASYILSVVPYYNKPSQDGIIAHFQALAEVSPLPIILYNVPGRTVVNMEPETTLKLASLSSKFVAVKDATDNVDKFMTLICRKPESFRVFAGDDALTYPFLSLGADGTISVIANAYPSFFSKMVSLCLKGDWESARKYHYAILPLLHTMLTVGNPAGIKAILSMKNLIKHYFRLPLVPLSHEKLQILKKAVEEFENNIKYL